jgi:hypothetical protein
MDTATIQYAPGDLRVSDADRDRAIGELSQHFQAGRLTLDEFNDRSGQALQAKTGRDLAGLFTDLPAAQTRTPAIGEPRRFGEPAGLGDAVAVHAARSYLPAARAVMALAALGAVAIVVSVFARTGVGHHGLFVPVPLLVVLFVVRLFIIRHLVGRRSRRGPGPVQ